jgi:nitrate reductase gamma subunit
MSSLHGFLFGIYPYIALAVFLIGSLIRFDREQYSWKSDSSQLLRRGQLRLGNNLFHVGVLLLFMGHLTLLVPKEMYHFFGLTTEGKQLLAIVAGTIFGLSAFAGLVLLVHRRLSEPRIRKTSTRMDIFILLWILATLTLGLVTIPFSLMHRDGAVMVALATWAQHIWTFRGDAAAFIAEVPLIYRVHLFFGMTMFLLFPFSRLVHVWSGFGSVAYLRRPYQIVRSKG